MSFADLCLTRRAPAKEVVPAVADAFEVAPEVVLDRSHQSAFEAAVYLLRRARNLPRRKTARLGVSHRRGFRAFKRSWRKASDLRRGKHYFDGIKSSTDPASLLVNRLDTGSSPTCHRSNGCRGLGILLDAKRRGLVPVVTPLIDDLQRLGFRLSEGTRRAVLRMAGEP